MTNSHLSAPSRPKDSAIQWATTAFRLGKDKGSAVALQERDGSIFVCVRAGDTQSWMPYNRVLSQEQLKNWIQTGGFPKQRAMR